MELNRREFLALTGSALAVRLDGRPEATSARGAVSVLHLEGDCCAAESIAGYRSALEACDVRFVTVNTRTATRCARTLIEDAHGGAMVLIESGLAENSLLTALGVSAADPTHLWRRDFSPALTAAIPYIKYGWPIPALVRDFSWVVPLSAVGWQPIAHVDDTCVGMTRRVGRGRIVMLGSPLGPVLRGGDREAREWLTALVDVTARPGSVPRSPQIALAAPETANVRSRA